MALCKNIKEARLSRGMTQAELAEHVNLTPSMITLVENGKRLLSTPKLKLTAKVLGVSVDWLLEGEEKEENNG